MKTGSKDFLNTEHLKQLQTCSYSVTLGSGEVFTNLVRQSGVGFSFLSDSSWEFYTDCNFSVLVLPSPLPLDIG